MNVRKLIRKTLGRSKPREKKKRVAIVFDFGSVLRVKTQERQRALDELIKRTNEKLKAAGSDLVIADHAGLKKHIKGPKKKEIQSGKISSKEGYTYALQSHGIQDQEFIDYYTQAYDFEGKHVLPEMYDFLAELKGKSGVVMGILSNHTRGLKDVMYKLNFVPKYFDEKNTLISALTGLRKPDPEAYINCLNALGFADNPEDVLFIDNRLKNVEGARKEGMQGIVYTFDPALCGDKGEGDVTLAALREEILQWIDNQQNATV